MELSADRSRRSRGGRHPKELKFSPEDDAEANKTLRQIGVIRGRWLIRLLVSSSIHHAFRS